MLDPGGRPTAARRAVSRATAGDTAPWTAQPRRHRRRDRRRKVSRARGRVRRMPSSALTSWRKRRNERLDDLLRAHRSVGGSARGRRWRTTTLNEALLLRLAAEFQGFARDLHPDACDVFAEWTAPSNPTLRQVVRARLIEGRELERGNAHPGSIGADFGRLGFDVWPALAVRDGRTAAHNRSLERLNDVRNGLAHANEAKLAKLRAEGVTFALGTYRKWRRDLDILADNLDAETAAQLGRLFGRQGPW